LPADYLRPAIRRVNLCRTPAAEHLLPYTCCWTTVS